MTRESYEHRQKGTVDKDASNSIEKGTGREKVISFGEAGYRAIFTWQ